MTIQAKLTAIAVNLKRIAALIDEKSGQVPALGAAIFTNRGIATPIRKK